MCRTRRVPVRGSGLRNCEGSCGLTIAWLLVFQSRVSRHQWGHPINRYNHTTSESLLSNDLNYISAVCTVLPCTRSRHHCPIIRHTFACVYVFGSVARVHATFTGEEWTNHGTLRRMVRAPRCGVMRHQRTVEPGSIPQAALRRNASSMWNRRGRAGCHWSRPTCSVLAVGPRPGNAPFAFRTAGRPGPASQRH